jgi:NTE family protein
LDFVQLERNVKAGQLDVLGVVATSALTGRSVVLHTGLRSPSRDARRGIDYVATRIGEDHVLASAAIPAIFPAVHVELPRLARGWYFDGGTRLNTPIKPALAFGADRVVVIAVNSLTSESSQLAGETRPDALHGAGQILLGLLEDQLAHDLQTLATINALVAGGGRSTTQPKRQVPYIVVSPRTTTTIGEIAQRVIREHCTGPLGAVRSPDLALLARLVAAEADPQHAEVLSYLLLAPQFANALIELGQQDASRWLAEPHELDDLWQIGPLIPI